MLTKDTASEYDFMVLLDASGSMSNPSTRFEGKSRWQEGQELITGLAGVLDGFDADGIDVITFGQKVEMFEGVTSGKVADIFQNVQPYGSTPTAEALALVVAKQARTGKNTVAFVLTDGEPSNKPAVESTIVNAANSLEKDEALSFQFIQIGRAEDATKFLQYLDDDLQSKGAKFDIVDTIPAEEAEQLSPLELINKAITD
jgi:hypothetical protein